MLRKELHNENRLAWNEATAAHNSHKRDQAAFLRRGGQTLFPEEKQLLGDIGGLSVVHLQCNAGQDTLSLAQMGARVTGVDISDTAIEFARELSSDSGIPATFIRDDVYNWLADKPGGQAAFDLVFSSYGALAWLSDIRLWAGGVAGVLKPVPGTIRNIDRLVLVQHPHILADRDLSGSAHHNPVLGPVVMPLQRQPPARFDHDALDLEPIALVHRLV